MDFKVSSWYYLFEAFFGGDKPTLVGYTDSDMGGYIDSRRFSSGYVIKFAGKAVA